MRWEPNSLQQLNDFDLWYTKVGFINLAQPTTAGAETVGHSFVVGPNASPVMLGRVGNLGIISYMDRQL